MKTALMVIDVQNEYFSGVRPVSYPSGSLENILKAMDAAHSHGLPIALIQHPSLNPQAEAFRKDSHGWELLPEVVKRPHDVIMQKNYPGSFTKTNLEAWLREGRIEKVVICGYMTQICCDTTARQAYHRGFKVDFLANATGTRDQKNSAGSITAEQLHRAFLIVQNSTFSRVLTTAEWIAEL